MGIAMAANNQTRVSEGSPRENYDQENDNEKDDETDRGRGREACCRTCGSAGSCAGRNASESAQGGSRQSRACESRARCDVRN